MSHSYARWALMALLLLSSTTFVQTATVEIPYNDPRVIYTPKDGWSTWTYNATVPCPGAWAPGASDGKHTISLSFEGTAVTVYGYSDGVAPWIYQLDSESPEASSVLPDIPCRVIKDSQGLKDGKHKVVVTPQSSSFVLTKFTVVTGGVLSGIGKNATNTTHTGSQSGSRGFKLDGGSLARVLFLVLPVYFFIALLL